MTSTISIDPFSSASRKLELFANGNLVATATGFFLLVNGITYLVSNFHCFSGKNVYTEKHLSPTTLAEPDEVRFIAFRDGDLNSIFTKSIRLRDEDGNPLWLEHADRRTGVDIAAVKCDLPPVEAAPINLVPQEKIYPTVASDVFILGYPAGIINIFTPVWKRGTIATEIELNFNDLPAFLVDTTTTTGMSGSPVIFRSTRMNNEKYFLQSSETFQRVIGIYSGRIPPIGGVETNLGFVWPMYLIYELIQGENLDRNFWDSIIPNRLGNPPPGMSSW